MERMCRKKNAYSLDVTMTYCDKFETYNRNVYFDVFQQDNFLK